MTSFTVDQVRDMLLAVCEAIVKNERLLCEADRKIGDGDHGLGMAKGFKAAGEMLRQESFASVNPIFSKVGQTLIKTMGGASGIIFGLLFHAGTKGLEDTTELTLAHLTVLMERSEREITAKGGARAGDKTMLDALVPFTESLRKSADAGIGLEEALRSAALAAEAGKEQSKELVAKFGKAKTLGERAVGHPDPGAVSLAIIAGTMAEWAAHRGAMAEA